MKSFRVVLSLITQDNDYQREQASVAEATAKRLGIQLRVLYANGDAIAQTHQVLAAIHAPAEERPDVVVVEPAGTGMPPVAKAAVQNGIGWVWSRDHRGRALEQHGHAELCRSPPGRLEPARLDVRTVCVEQPS